MRGHWKTDPCYAHYGVDGSECSFRVYLSELESFCPLVQGRTRPQPPRNKTTQFQPVPYTLFIIKAHFTLFSSSRILIPLNVSCPVVARARCS